MQWSSEINHSLADNIGDGDGSWLPPMSRGRISRLRWLFNYIEEKGWSGASTETIRSIMSGKFGLRARTVDEYIAALASQSIILSKGGVWVTLRNSLPDK